MLVSHRAAPSLGDPLKKSVAVLGVSVMLSLTGCSQQLSTSETCVEFKALGGLLTDGGAAAAPEEVQAEYLEKLDSLAARSSDTLKDVLRDVALVNHEWAKPVHDQDAAKIERIQLRIDPKSGMLNEACDL